MTFNKNYRDQCLFVTSKNEAQKSGRAIFSTKVEALLLWMCAEEAATDIGPAKAG